MKIKVRAFASFREMLGSELELDLPDESSVQELLDALASLNPRFCSEAFDRSGLLKDYVLLMKNRKRLDRDSMNQALEDGDEVAVFPPVSGG
ncbi:MAG: MoaD/ThiS family protein [Methanotrichaceae archaeon]|nr:MoaD/ThiS family protein [Methanotrichaceae archaeon]